MMQDIEKALRVVTGQAKGEVRAALVVLDQVVAQSGESLPLRLAHFLERRSYVKALAFIVDGETFE